MPYIEDHKVFLCFVLFCFGWRVCVLYVFNETISVGVTRLSIELLKLICAIPAHLCAYLLMLSTMQR